MGFADWIVPGRRRRNIALSLDRVADAARSTPQTDALDTRRAELWNILCDASRNTLRLLLIGGDDRIDWALRRQLWRINDARLVVLFWWMLLYQLALFNNRSIEGYDPADDMDALYDIARAFVVSEFSRMDIASEPPGAWAENWRQQFTLESAMALYNHTYILLGIRGDLTRRIEHVSRFTTATEREFDRMKRAIGR